MEKIRDPVQEKEGLYKVVSQLKVENDWLKKESEQVFGNGEALISSIKTIKASRIKTGRMKLVDKTNAKLSIGRQCELLELARSSYYYEPSSETEENLRLMRQIDELHLKYLFHGVKRMRAALATDD